MISGYLKHLKTVLMALIALPLLAGCASESDEPVPADTEEVILCLNIVSPYRGLSSRVTYEDPEGDFEKITTLRVIIMNNVDNVNGTGQVEANRLVRTDALGNPQYDNLRFRVISDQMKRIYLIANESSLTPPAILNTDGEPKFSTATQFLDSCLVNKEVNLSDLANWTVSLPHPTETTSTSSVGLFYPASGYTQLPLTESFDIFVERRILPNTTGQTEDYSDADLFITRAAAKASFFINPASSREYTITALSLSGVGTEEYVFPSKTTYDPQKYTGDQVNVVENGERYITSFAIPQSADTTTFIVNGLQVNLNKLLPAATTGESVYVPGSRMYFPESILPSDKKYKIGVQLNGDIWLYADLETKDANVADILNVGGKDAIARDTHLKIDVTINDARNITCYVQLVPYISVVLNPTFGFDQPYPPYSYTPITPEE